MINGYTHNDIIITHPLADSVAIKGNNTAPTVISMTSGVCTYTTNTAGDYYLQFFKSSQVIDDDKLTVKQNLQYVASNYDPRSQARIALDAINAFMCGRATAQQRKVKVGDKQIEYSSYDQLVKWKHHFEKEVRKQQGKPLALKSEKLMYRG